MAHEVALEIVNSMHKQLVTLVKTAAAARSDNKVTPMEGFMVATKGMSLATFVLQVMQDEDVQTRKDIVYVLENGQWALPE